MTAQSDDVEVRKVEQTRLYEAVIAGEVVGSLGYETVGGKTALTHSFVEPERRNRGVGSALAEFALTDVTASGVRPTIYCGFVADYVDTHPEWKGAVDISHWTIPTRSTRPGVADTARAEDGAAREDQQAQAMSAGESEL